MFLFYEGLDSNKNAFSLKKNKTLYFMDSYDFDLKFGLFYEGLQLLFKEDMVFLGSEASKFLYFVKPDV